MIKELNEIFSVIEKYGYLKRKKIVKKTELSQYRRWTRRCKITFNRVQRDLAKLEQSNKDDKRQRIKLLESLYGDAHIFAFGLLRTRLTVQQLILYHCVRNKKK